MLTYYNIRKCFTILTQKYLGCQNLTMSIDIFNRLDTAWLCQGMCQVI